ncbi:MAG TPA: AmmeMemoRadiSam system protein A [bacterium]|nr:AmmeMemoRadiSam system protein A [bacterium]
MSELAKQEKIELLRLARRAIELLLRERRVDVLVSETLALARPGGVFVSLHCQGHLRGCIGRIRSPDPLFRTVQEMAVAAASQDFRFYPLHLDELLELEIEISALSVPEPIRPEAVVVGKHGLIVTQGFSSGLLLPQVATQYGWDAETFLSHTAEKAGLGAHDWKSPRSRIEAFTAEVFSEKSLRELG